ncbi:hydrogenase formation protein HypD [Myxococcota bacterium]|nr:hydrogenase formation protein HypD [Myxococcota bacterium]MBU1379255.1 hydrogenase formation protein HypD [Myxococcota bacterium]MBU1496111.1 hydrogenase formation protein HypD [Myxococcota bacterium]
MTGIRETIKALSTQIHNLAQDREELCFMEVCGTHTMSIAKHGVRALLPSNVRIISGPGCPVCVSTVSDIENCISLAMRPDTIVATFGDMLKVPGVNHSLSEFPSVKIIYSPMQAVELARLNTDKNIVLLGIGFETTTPLMAAAVKAAEKLQLRNFFLYSMARTVPRALELLLNAPDNSLTGFILPGHVSAITGVRYYDFMKAWPTRGVITGFEMLDIMQSLYLLVSLAVNNRCEVVNNYPEWVKEDGNRKAMDTVSDVFIPCDSYWRGIGLIPESGLKMREEFAQFDASIKFGLENRDIPDPPGCLCGRILLGKNLPSDCGHFGKSCTPSRPVGPCMVSSEGTCAAWFKYIMP